MSDTSNDLSPRLGGQKSPLGSEPALTGDRALLHALEMLNAPDDQTRFAAVSALGDLGDERAIEHLVRILYDAGQQSHIRGRALYSLASYGLLGLDHFAAMLHSDDLEIAQTGISGLELLMRQPEGPRKVSPILLDALVNGGVVQRCFVASQLTTLVRHGGVRGIFPALMRALDDPSDYVRMLVLDALAILRDRRAIPKMRALLTARGFVVRMSAVEALATMRDRRALPRIIEMLQGDNEDEWRGAALALGRIGDPRAIPALVNVTRDPHRPTDVRRQCVESVYRIDSPTTPDELVAILRDRAIPGEVRFRCCEGLSIRGDAGTYKVLVEALDDPDFVVRRSAIGAVEQLARRIGIETVPRAAIDALITCLPDTRVAYEGSAPYTEDHTIQSLAAGALRGIGTAEVARALEDWRRRQAHSEG